MADRQDHMGRILGGDVFSKEDVGLGGGAVVPAGLAEHLEARFQAPSYIVGNGLDGAINASLRLARREGEMSVIEYIRNLTRPAE